MRHNQWDAARHGPVQYGSGQQNIAIGGDVNAPYRGSVYVVKHGTAALPDHVEAGFVSIQEQLAELRLSRSERQVAETEIRRAQEVLTSSAPDRRQAAQHLQNFLSILERAGSAASALEPIGKAVGTIARWLGPIGGALLASL